MLSSVAGAVVAFALVPGSNEGKRLLGVVLLFLLGVGAVVFLIRRPRPARPHTRDGAMLGAVLIAGFCMLAFGFLPNEWLNYAGSQLHWDRRDVIMINLPDVIPFDISRQAIRDLVAANVYVLNFALLCRLWIMWQKRHELAAQRQREAAEPAAAEAAPSPVAVPVGTSAFGRPVSRADRG